MKAFAFSLQTVIEQVINTQQMHVPPSLRRFLHPAAVSALAENIIAAVDGLRENRINLFSAKQNSDRICHQKLLVLLLFSDIPSSLHQFFADVGQFFLQVK